MNTLDQSGTVGLYVRPQSLKYILGWLIAGMRGGTTRAKMIVALRQSPQNANQLAAIVGKDYRTIRHHLGVLEKNRLIMSAGEKYASTYFLSPEMEENYPLFEEILKKVLEREAHKSE